MSFLPLLKRLHIYYSWKAQIVIIIKEMFRTLSSWMLFISVHPAVHAAPLHNASLFYLFVHYFLSPLGDLFLASIEIREFCGIGYDK